MSEVPNYRLFNNDCLDVLRTIEGRVDCIFADPPDNIGLKYSAHKDDLADEDYIAFLQEWLWHAIKKALCIWLSYNTKWWANVGRIITEIEAHFGSSIEVKHCVQTFTFGQHNHHDLGNNHRPLLRIRWSDSLLYPDAIRVPSWRQLNGDKRADPRGRVPGDVFDFPRVTGNSKQRRRWCPTQLNEGLVERCLLLTTKPGDLVLDPFAGSGTTLRVCKRIDRRCILIETSPNYCEKIAEEHDLEIEKLPAEGRAVEGSRSSNSKFLKGQQTLFPLEEAA